MVVYKITNKINGKVYIGQTIQTLGRRWKKHVRYSENNSKTAIHNAIRKYGPENFTIEEIDGANSLSELNYLETHYIYKHESLAPNGYNLKIGGSNSLYTDEAKAKMSKSHTGKKLSKEHRNNISKSVIKFFKENPETANKVREIASKTLTKYMSKNPHPKKGKKLSKESRERISQSKMGDKNPMYGKKSNDAQRKALMKGQEIRRNNLKKVLCHQNKKVYNTVTEAAKDLGFARSSVSNVLTGFRKNLKGFTFEYLNKY